MKEKFCVSGMTCAACSAAVEKAVKKVDGVNTVAVNLLDNSMMVEHDGSSATAQAIITAVDKAGYHASYAAKKQTESHTEENQIVDSQKEQKAKLLLSVLFLIPLMWVSMGHMMGLPLPQALVGTKGAIPFALTQFLLTLPIMYINRSYYQKGFKTLLHGSPNMDSLIAIGSGAAVIYGIFALYRMAWALASNDLETVGRYHMDLYFESAGTILTLITFGKFLEARAKKKTGAAIQSLLELIPKTATVLKNGQEVEAPIEEISVDDIVVIKPGMRIPVDGVVVSGSSSVDESAITGESIPSSKKVGDKVISATINKTGSFTFKVTRVGIDTTLSQIVELVKQAGSAKAPIAKLADKVSGVFVPLVLLISLVSFVVWMFAGQSLEFALSRAIAVLVISCPCALGLATPVAIMVGTGKGAKFGVLFHDAQALENLHHIDTIVLDKTGTITNGKPFVTDVAFAEGVDEAQFWQAAYALESSSEHPLAEAIVEYAKEKGVPTNTAVKFMAVEGKGISAEWDGARWDVGNARLMQERQVTVNVVEEISTLLASQGKTPVYFSCEGKLQAVVAIADTIKESSKTAIQEFEKMGVEVWMLTGDNKRTAAAIQQQLKIENVKAEVLPQDKAELVKDLQAQGKKVAMVGDGINDAPALASADIGIAIGAGTDIAIEAADVILMKSNLMDVLTAMRLSKQVLKNIKENLFWAFFYNMVGIPLAAGVFWNAFHLALNPMFGAAAMSLSSVCVVSNALRLNYFKNSFKTADEKEHPVISDVKVHPSFVVDENNLTLSEESANLKVEGMMCQHCVARVTKAIEKTGAHALNVDLDTKTAHIAYGESIKIDDILESLNKAGYPAEKV